MIAGKLNQDATASSKGNIYQFCVAVNKCYEMTECQKVLIESLGDVTVDGIQQIETKHYKNPLTDSHINFWKTLRNWMDDDFDPAPYASLILHTTQQFGERSKISEWNGSPLDKRLKILKEIYQQTEEKHKTKRLKEKQKKAQKIRSETTANSVVLSYQQFILDYTRQEKLSQVANKFVIQVNSPKLPELYSLIKQQHLKGILYKNQDNFLYALIGFITQPQATKSQSWEITYDDFTKKVEDLTDIYHQGTRLFPRKCLDNSQKIDEEELRAYYTYTFVKKIYDIEYFEFVSEAIRDYIGALQTVREDFKDYRVPPSRTDRYVAELVKVFEKSYRIASRSCRDIIFDSQDFYDEITKEESRSFEGFEKPDLAFKNGLLHVQLDDENKNLQWRLKRL